MKIIMMSQDVAIKKKDHSFKKSQSDMAAASLYIESRKCESLKVGNWRDRQHYTAGGVGTSTYRAVGSSFSLISLLCHTAFITLHGADWYKMNFRFK